MLLKLTFDYIRISEFKLNKATTIYCKTFFFYKISGIIFLLYRHFVMWGNLSIVDSY